MRYRFIMSFNNNINNCGIRITNHAYKRAHQRFGWNAHAIERMSGIAFESGLNGINTKGRLKKYMDKLLNESKKRNKSITNLRIYGESLFLFSDHCLITVWQLPFELRSLAKVLKLKQFNAKVA